MMQCGRRRTKLAQGWTTFVEGELAYLHAGTLLLDIGESYTLNTGEREFTFVLVYGECDFHIQGRSSGRLGPRSNPFTDMPSGLLVTREETVTITAKQPSLIGAGSAPAAVKMDNCLITSEQTRQVKRGAGNWSREVRMIIWNDNTEANMIMAGETLTPSGNWSTIPPHRHQHDIPGEEVPYDEVYFFQFSKPQGFGLIYQFDDEGSMDQAFSLKADDCVYVGGGYHPIGCAPGADLYHLTIMAGPYRKSVQTVHKDYQFMLDEAQMTNPFMKQK